MGVDGESHSEHVRVNTLCGQSAKCMNVTADRPMYL